MDNQLGILSESLEQKIQVLLEIQQYNQKQEEAFGGEEPDLEAFDEAVEAKDSLIDKLLRLDSGFETLYAGVSKQLKADRQQYAAQIKGLQNQIARVTELSVSIQAQEARNKKMVEDYFAKARSGIKQGRQSSKVAYDYYKNMGGMPYDTSRFMDSKN